MKLAFIYIGICILGALVAGFFPSAGINREGIDLLFTISGIIFSVGMSLVITSNTQNIRKLSIRKKIHQQRTDIAVGYVWNFALLSLLYVLIISFPSLKSLEVLPIFKSWALSPSIAFLIMAIEVNIYFVLNFFYIMELNNDIENYTINDE